MNRVAAVPMMKDGRCADHRMPREVELFEEVEDACPPMMLPSGGIEKDGLELAQLAGDLRHLGAAEAAGVGKDGQAVAAVGSRGEHVDELELHRHDATRAPVVRSCRPLHQEGGDARSFGRRCTPEVIEATRWSLPSLTSICWAGASNCRRRSGEWSQSCRHDLVSEMKYVINQQN